MAPSGGGFFDCTQVPLTALARDTGISARTLQRWHHLYRTQVSCVQPVFTRSAPPKQLQKGLLPARLRKSAHPTVDPSCGSRTFQLIPLPNAMIGID